jgi:DNA repair protein RadA/Sms
MAVLEKRAGIHLGSCDAYVNLTGGIRLSEPAIDLGIILALVSSYRNRAVDEHTIIFGEVGLTGEVRGVNMAEQRVREAAKLGFTTCILPATNATNIKGITGIKLIGVSNVKESIDLI